jgi:hypothetical protein
MEFLKVVVAAVLRINENKRALSKALARSFAAFFIIDLLSLFNLPSSVFWFVSMLEFGVYAIFAIIIHRILLFGPRAVAPWGITSWSDRETSFVLHIIGICLLITPIFSIFIGFFHSSVPATTVTVTLVLLGALLTGWIVSRLSLVFPGIATDKDMSFRLSWKMTANHQLLMMAVVLLLPLLLIFPVTLLDYIPYSFLLVSLGATIALAFEIAVLSVAYQRIARSINAAGE